MTIMKIMEVQNDIEQLTQKRKHRNMTHAADGICIFFSEPLKGVLNL
jgi:hypothetical protein